MDDSNSENSGSSNEQFIDTLEESLARNSAEILDINHQSRCVTVHLHSLSRIIDDIGECLCKDAEFTIQLLTAAINQLIKNRKEYYFSDRSYSVILVGHSPVISLKQACQVKSGKFVSVEAQIDYVDTVTLEVTNVDLICIYGHTTTITIEAFNYISNEELKFCSECMNLTAKKVAQIPSQMLKHVQATQRLILRTPAPFVSQQAPSHAFEALLVSHLTGVFQRGDIIIASGVVKTISEINTKWKASQIQGGKYLHVNNAQMSSENQLSNNKMDFNEMHADISMQKNCWNDQHNDLIMQFMQILEKKRRFVPVACAIFCSTIPGKEIVKAGLILSCLTNVESGKKNACSRCHILLVGDETNETSELCLATARIAGNAWFGSSAALQKVIGKEKTTALKQIAQQHNNGTLCVQDFQLLSTKETWSDLRAIMMAASSKNHETIHCTVIASVSLPKFDYAQTIAEHLRMPASSLESFGLIFVVNDSAEDHRDSIYADRSLKALDRDATKKRCRFEKQCQNNREETKFDLTFRLMSPEDRQLDLIPSEAMRLWCTYCRLFCHPAISIDAANFITDWWCSHMLIASELDAMPVTKRALETAFELTFARARLELSSNATVEHAQDAIAIVDASLHSRKTQLDNDEDSLFDFTLKKGRKNLQSQITHFIHILEYSCNDMHVFTRNNLETIFNGCNFENICFEQFLDKLQNQFHELLSCGE